MSPLYLYLKVLLLLASIVIMAAGQERIWTRMVSTSGSDIGRGVAVHPSTGDVYVTGNAQGALHGQPYVASNDIILIKYASNGTRVWTRMEGTSGGDIGFGVAVHPSTGDVYVTGNAQGALHDQPHVVSNDIVLIKYASNGTRVWTRMEGTSGNDIGFGVAVHPSTGDVYATGNAQGALHGQPYLASNDIILIKYASNGTRVWTRMEGTNSNDNDRGFGVAVHHSTGDVYVTGFSLGALHGQPHVASIDIILIKYASNGTRVWTRMAGTSGGDEGRGVAVHPSTGDVYVTGYAGGALHGQPYVASIDILLMKYASNGTRVWTRMEAGSGNDEGKGVSVHHSTGDVYVTGYAGGALHEQPYAGLNDILLIKYASDGTRVWTRMVGTGGNDEGFGVAVHPSTGDVYATGNAQGALHGQPYVASNDIILIKYASGGTRVWTRMEGTLGDDRGYGVAVHPSTGDVYVTGYAGGALHGQPYVASNDIILIKYASNGTRVWTRMEGTSGGDIGFGVAVHPSTGDVYVTGNAQGALHDQPHVVSNDIVLIKYASNGTRVWTRMEGTSGNDIGFGVAVHPSTGDVYATGNAQ
eukprot:gene34547-41830_t